MKKEHTKLISLLKEEKSITLATRMAEELPNESYSVTSILRAMINRENVDLLKDFPHAHCTTTINALYDDDKEASIGAVLHIYCDSREEAIEKAKDQFGVELPKECKKYGSLENGQPKTLIEHIIDLEVEGIQLKVTFNYKRDGLPTSKCRVVSETTQSIVCDL